jgi:hypothetical protein
VKFHCKNGLQCLAPKSCICICDGCTDPRFFESGRLLEDSRTPRTLYKLSEAGATSFTATLVHPKPGHTTVHTFGLHEMRYFREPTNALVRRYEKSWGLSPQALPPPYGPCSECGGRRGSHSKSCSRSLSEQA